MDRKDLRYIVLCEYQAIAAFDNQEAAAKYMEQSIARDVAKGLELFSHWAGTTSSSTKPYSISIVDQTPWWN